MYTPYVFNLFKNLKQVFMKTIFLAAAMVSGAFISTAHAQETIGEKSRNERQRIEQGVKSGELTRNETRNLISGERDIHRDIRAAKADGVVTRRERKHIRRDERKESRRICRSRHNHRQRH